MFSQAAFLSRKKIDYAIFSNCTLTFQSALTEHSAFAFRHFYSQPYLNKKELTYGFVRFYHGIAHANRVAIFASVMANLYRRYGDHEAILLTKTDLRLIQITALFHDACREDDGHDYWDQDSAVALYYYLMVLGAGQQKSILLAEAIANKDADADYYQLQVSTDGQLSWIKQQSRPKNCYQKIIHDADCLDIIRARTQFDARYLDFYKYIAEIDDVAFEEMAQLIAEVRSVIENQGDSYCQPKLSVKKIYDSEEGFYSSVKSCVSDSHILLKQFLQGNSMSLYTEKELKNISVLEKGKYNKQGGLTETNLKFAMREGKLFARGITCVSGISPKHRTYINGVATVETLAEVEIRKFKRRVGVRTTTSKADGDKKHGNQHRSISMLGYGAGVFAPVGFLIVDCDVNKISSITAGNASSGFKKKAHFVQSLQPMTYVEKERQLTALKRKLKMGGVSVDYYHFISTHNEITYHLDDVDAIYFSHDPTVRNMTDFKKARPVHDYSPLLQAYYVQLEYERLHGIVLPIVEYSGLHNSIRFVLAEEYSNSRVIAMWVAMCVAYMRTKVMGELRDIKTFVTQTLDEMKVCAMYCIEGVHESTLFRGIFPADINYSSPLYDAVTEALQAERVRLIESLQHDKRILIAALSNDLAVFNRLFEQYSSNELWFKLHADAVIQAAILAGHNAILDVLFSHKDYKEKMLFSTCDQHGLTAALYAIFAGHHILFKRLLKEGADINAYVQKESLALSLHYAITKNYIDCVEALLDVGLDPNLSWQQDGLSPLSYAESLGFVQIAKLLISRGAHHTQPKRVQHGEANQLQAFSLFTSQGNQTPAVQASTIFAGGFPGSPR